MEVRPSRNSVTVRTAISAALGFAKARDLKGENYEVIALVGDSSFNNGLVYEALNSIKILHSRVLILLNDNGMSISPTVGGMHEMLSEMKKTAGDVKIFERFGLTYRGVVNGNDLSELLPALEERRTASAPTGSRRNTTKRSAKSFAPLRKRTKRSWRSLPP